MELDEYQEDAATTAIYPHKGQAMGLVYTGLKLSGEAAEVGQLIGKAIRDTDFPESCAICSRVWFIYATSSGFGKLSSWSR